MFIRNLVLGALIGILCAFSSVALSQAQAPAAEVKAAVDRVLGLLTNESLEADDRRTRLREVIAPHFDFEAMSRSILAREWKKATPEERKQFLVLFQKLLENTYITAMEDYSGQNVRYGRERVIGELATVETFLSRASAAETPVLYRLRVNNGRWLAYDVAVEGVSLVNNYRSSFRSIAKKEGMSGLIAQLDKKLNAGN